MSETVFQHAIKTAGKMIAFAIVGTFMLSVIHTLTADPIAENERLAKLALFKQVIPKSEYDNDILTSTLAIAPDALLGTRNASTAHIATMQQKPVGVILEAIAHDGYAGDIKLLIAIRSNGQISGVRVLAHKETPGLGDYIDFAKDQWIQIFDQESLTKTPPAKWKVRKDGGQFDYRVGATITPRAVVKKVHETLQYFEQNRSSLLAVPTQSESAAAAKTKEKL